MLVQPFTMNDLNKVINLRPNIAPDPENVHHPMIKNLTAHTKVVINTLKCGQKGNFQVSEIVHLIVPVLKPNKIVRFVILYARLLFPYEC